MTEKYDIIGKGYNTTRKADPYLSSRLFHLLSPVKGETYLDIGCGTGNYTIALNEMGVDFIAIDPSEEMLKIARSKNSNIDWKLIVGAFCFGLGWGISGLCPGPAIVQFSVFTIQIQVVWFGCLIVGQQIAALVDKKTQKKV